MSWLLLVVCIIYVEPYVFALDLSERQERLNNVISETMSQNSYLFSAEKFNPPFEDKSEIHSLCSRIPLNHSARNRVGCCQYSKSRILYNVQLRGKKFVFMYDNPSLDEIIPLPTLNNLRLQKLNRLSEVSNVVHTRGQKTKCTQYFNGTLHVIPDRTYHKLYHAVGDNYAPLAAQVLMDAVLDDAFLLLPRMKVHIMTSARDQPSQYIYLTNFIFSAGTRSSNELNGWCFRRVLYGPGPYVFYNDQRVALRRAVADFARNQVNMEFDMDKAIPLEYATSSPKYPAFTSVYRGASHIPPPSPQPKKAPRKPRSPGKTTTRGVPRRLQSVTTSRRRLLPASHNLVWNTTITQFPETKPGYQPLRIVLYSRGNEGTRTLKLESHLMSAIGEKFGAYTAICCDFNKVTIQQQISYAYHADIIMGLHGAALVHGIFARKGLVMIEYKMQYAYTSLLFPLVTDSRVGIHAVLDTRPYFFVRGQRIKPGSRIPDGAVDARLINRTTHLLQYVLEFPLNSTNVGLHSPKTYPHDFTFGSIKLRGSLTSFSHEEELVHVLGPYYTNNITDKCQRMILSRARHEILLSQKQKGNSTGNILESSNAIHCPKCYEE